MEIDKVRWGVLGWARIAREQVVPAILRSRNAIVHALGSREAKKLVEVRSRFAVPNLYESYDEVLADRNVEAVYIPLPNALHAPWTIKAAEAGKHVLCEKPLGLDAQEARQMIDACKASGVKLMEAFMYRYTERTRLVRELVASGIIGEIKFLEAEFRFLLANPQSIKLQPELGGGALYDVGCYPVNFAGMLMKGKPVSVSAQAYRSGGIDVRTSALLRYEDGSIAALHCGFDAQRRIHAHIVGTLGVLDVPDTFLDNEGSIVVTTEEGTSEIAVPASDRYKAEVEDFSDAVRNNREPLFSSSETVTNMEVLAQIMALIA